MNLDFKNALSSDPNELLLNWSKYNIIKKEYKVQNKKLTIVDRTNGEMLEIHSSIRATDQTDLEITFFCQNVFVNNMDLDVFLFTNDRVPR